MVNQYRVANMLLTDDPDIEVVVAEVGVGVATVDPVAITAIVIVTIQKQPRKREVTKRMTVINLKLMKSQGVLVVMQVEDVVEAAEEDVAEGDGLDVVIAVKVLVMKILHQMGKVARIIREIVQRVSAEAPDVVAVEAVDQDVTGEDPDVHLHKAPVMKVIGITIAEMVTKTVSNAEEIAEIKIATVKVIGSHAVMVMTIKENVVVADRDVLDIDDHVTTIATNVVMTVAMNVVTKNLKLKVTGKKNHHRHNKFKSKLKTISNSSNIIGEVCINRSVHSLKIRERT